MIALFGLFIIVGLLYVMGRLVYPSTTTHTTIFVKIFLQFIAIIAASAVVMLAVSALLLTPIIFISSLLPETAEPIGKLPTGQLLVILLIVILATAIAHYILRRRLLQKVPFLRLTNEEYVIFEYFIQWITIYVVVYQFMFNGVIAVVKLIPEVSISADAFAVLLSPDNINMALQPLLIATWILVVMEKLHFEKQPAPQAVKKTKKKR